MTYKGLLKVLSSNVTFLGSKLCSLSLKFLTLFISDSLRASSFRCFSNAIASISLMYSFRTSFTCFAYSLRSSPSIASASLGSFGACQLPIKELGERNARVANERTCERDNVFNIIEFKSKT